MFGHGDYYAGRLAVMRIVGEERHHVGFTRGELYRSFYQQVLRQYYYAMRITLRYGYNMRRARRRRLITLLLFNIERAI